MALRGSVLISVFARNSISVNFRLPIDGDVTRALRVNFNRGLLLSSARSR